MLMIVNFLLALVKDAWSRGGGAFSDRRGSQPRSTGAKLGERSIRSHLGLCELAVFFFCVAMIAAASLAARAVTIDPDQADYYRGLGQELFSRWEDVTGEDYRSVDMGIKRTEYREDR